MGTFDYTCSISDLPIHARDPVRFLLLVESPYCKGAVNADYLGDRWAPLSFPLQAKYDAYSSIEDILPSPIKGLWVETLREDLVEKDLGENPYHDPAVKKGMTVEEMLWPLCEGRLGIKPCMGGWGELAVAQAMIREDVWQAILGLRGPYAGTQYGTPKNLDGWKDAALAYWNKLRDAIENHPWKVYSVTQDMFAENSVAGSLLTERPHGGLRRSFEIMCRKGLEGDDLKGFLDTVGEFTCIQHLLGQLRFQWRPGASCGPQFGEWKLHRDFHKALGKLATAEIKRQREDT